MEPHIDRETFWEERYRLSQYHNHALQKRFREAHKRPRKHTVKGEAVAFGKELWRHCRSFACEFGRECLRLVGLA